MLTQKERAEILARLLQKDFAGVSDVVHNARYLARKDKIALLTTVINYQGGDPDAEEDLLDMINGVFVA
jgi:hypothetical protein